MVVFTLNQQTVCPMFLRFLAILVAIVTLSACTYNISAEGLYQNGDPFRVSDQVTDESYEKLSLFWWGEYAGHRSNVYLKRYNKDGRLVICGMRVRSAGLASALETEWFEEGEIVIDGANIVAMDFLRPQDDQFNKEGDAASCVNTGWPAHESLMTRKIRVDGMPVRLRI